MAADTIPEWPQQRLTPPQPTIVPYWLRLDQFPETLQGEIANHLHRLAHLDPFLGPSRQGLATSTLHQHRILLITLGSALVATGTPTDELTSIADLVRPDRLEQALRFLHRRAGGRVNDQIYQITYRSGGLPPTPACPSRTSPGSTRSPPRSSASTRPSRA